MELISTEDIAREFGRDPPSTYRLAMRYKAELGPFAVEEVRSGRPGRPRRCALLSQLQRDQLVALMKNTRMVEAKLDLPKISLAEVDMDQFIDNDARSDARWASLVFGRAHKNLLRSVDQMINSPEPAISAFARLNFEPSSYETADGKRKRSYRMTRAGFSELAMSFHGVVARLTRIKFLEAFDRRLQTAISMQAAFDEHELRWAPSKAVAGFCASGLAARKQQKKVEKSEEAALKGLSQGKLFDPGALQIRPITSSTSSTTSSTPMIPEGP